MTPVLYVVKPPVETVSSRYHRLSIDSQNSEDRDITDKFPVNAASYNQSAANVIANILLSHRYNLLRLIYNLLIFPNS
jgi:hypothetical protein